LLGRHHQWIEGVLISPTSHKNKKYQKYFALLSLFVLPYAFNLLASSLAKIMDPIKVFYLDHLRSICARAETPTSLVEGKSLNEHAHFVRHHLSQKGRLLWRQINCLLCYAWNLCEIYDFTCCSKNPQKHLPYLCEFNDNEILSSYAKGVYN
jgi:hypothetical protein